MAKFVSKNQEDPMITLCRMVIHTRYEDLQPHVVAHAKRSILDTLGVIIGGSALEGIPEMVDFVKAKGGKPESMIPFYGGKVPASEAGLALGPMARAMDCGEVHPEAGHCSEYVLPTLLATTGLKDKVTGKEFVTAYVLGQEVVIRIGMAFKGISRGVPTGRSMGHCIFGAVAAAGKLLGLSEDELENAEGIARGMTQPHDFAMCNEGKLMIRIHHGFVCQDAINACLLAKQGITGPRREVLLGSRGYLGFAKWETEPDALTQGLGEEWEMVNVMVKPYTSCRGTHSAIDGILDQMTAHDVDPEDIAHIEISESPSNWVLVCEPPEAKWNPQTVPDCQFSLPYVIATAAYDKEVFLTSYTPQAMARQNVRQLMTRISLKKDSSLSTFGARITITLKDGRKYSGEYPYSKGDPKNPLSEHELIEKFRRCVPYSAYPLSERIVESVINAIMHLEKIDDVAEVLLLPLTPQ